MRYTRGTPGARSRDARVRDEGIVDATCCSLFFFRRAFALLRSFRVGRETSFVAFTSLRAFAPGRSFAARVRVHPSTTTSSTQISRSAVMLVRARRRWRSRRRLGARRTERARRHADDREIAPLRFRRTPRTRSPSARTPPPPWFRFARSRTGTAARRRGTPAGPIDVVVDARLARHANRRARRSEPGEGFQRLSHGKCARSRPPGLTRKHVATTQPLCRRRSHRALFPIRGGTARRFGPCTRRVPTGRGPRRNATISSALSCCLLPLRAPAERRHALVRPAADDQDAVFVPRLARREPSRGAERASTGVFVSQRTGRNRNIAFP